MNDKDRIAAVNKFTRWIFILFLLLLFSGCRIDDPTSSRDVYDILSVDAIIAPDTAFLMTRFPIQIDGYLPDPSWEFDHFEFMADDTSLIIKPVGRHNLDVDAAAAVLVPYEKETSYMAAQSGLLHVIVQGKNDSLQTVVIIIRDSIEKGMIR